MGMKAADCLGTDRKCVRGAHFNTQESTRCLDSGLVLEIKRVCSHLFSGSTF